MHQKVSKYLETAGNLGWTAVKNETSFGIGFRKFLTMSMDFDNHKNYVKFFF